MTNIYETNDLVDFLSKEGITSKQFMYCLLLHYDKKYSRIPGTNKVSRPLSKLYKYHNNVEKFSREDLKTLLDKGFIEKTGSKLVPDMLEITDKFSKAYLGDSLKFEELYETYPAWVKNFSHPSGGDIPLKNMNDYVATESLYNRFVKTDKNHKRVIEAVKWGKETNNINMSIEKFVNSKGWEALWELKSTTSSDDQFEII